jgi:hypothetical protein
MFDNTCKFLAESFFEDFASCLSGEPFASVFIALKQIDPKLAFPMNLNFQTNS